MAQARSIGLALLALAAAWLWLLLGVPIASGLAGAHGSEGGELVFTLVVFGGLLTLALGIGALGGVRIFRSGDRPGGALLGGLVLGSAGLSLAIGYCALAGTTQWRAASVSGPALAIGVATVGVQVLAEEALFRGVVQPLLVRAIGRAGGLLLAAAAFAGLHAIHGSSGGWLTLVNLLLGGVLFGCLALREGGIAGATGAHFGWNAAEQLAFGAEPNPGVGAFGSVFDVELVGASGWGGSDEGLNASWAMTLALLALLAFVLVRMRAPRVRG